MTARLALIVAVARNGVIGRDGGLPWHISADLRHFKATTMGKPIIMGRRTFESIGRALPGRTNIVVTRSAEFMATDVAVADSFEQALAIAEKEDTEEVMVIGGGAIYAAALPRADRIYLTEVHIDTAGDVRFPPLDGDQWREVSREDHAAEGDTPAFTFVVLERGAR